MKTNYTVFLFIAIFMGLGGYALSQEVSPYQISSVTNGGTLAGLVLFQGEIPLPQELTVDADLPICGKTPKYDESVIVSKENHGLQNVVVWIANMSRGKSWPAGAKRPVLDQKGCRFAPHVLVVPVGLKFNVLNNDNTLHTVHVHGDKNRSINYAMPPFMKKIPLKFDAPEIMKVTCDVHSWMSAWIVVAAHPYYSVTDRSGNYTITDIPAGTYQINLWHEKLGIETESVTITGGQVVRVDAQFAMP